MIKFKDEEKVGFIGYVLSTILLIIMLTMITIYLEIGYQGVEDPNIVFYSVGFWVVWLSLAYIFHRIQIQMAKEILKRLRK